MTNKFSFLAALAATTMLVGGAALADQAPAPTSGASKTSAAQTALDQDFGKLSKAGARGYQDLMATRLAIFDGHINEAKKTIADAEKAFDKAKTDASVFTKAETDLKTPADMAARHADAATANTKTASAQPKGTAGSSPVKWLPVDGAISVAEDFSASPVKTKAVADANKSLAAGDRKGALEKLKLAAVDTDVVLAVVPLSPTLDAVHKADGLITDGKYYEASQVLRQVEDSTRYDVADMTGVPAKAAASAEDKASTPGGKAAAADASGTPAGSTAGH